MATYYIDPTGVDDAGRSGLTIATAWATLSYACTRVTNAGDTIYVNAGTYTETARSVLSVSVSIMGAGKTLSIIKYTYANTTWSNACIVLESATEGTLGNQSISHLTIDGETTAYHGILVGRRSNVSLHDLVMVDFRYNAINIRGSYVNETEPTIYATNNKIYNCSITNCSVKAYVGGASGDGQVRFSFQDGILVHDNIFDNTLAAAGTAANNLDLKLGYNKNMQYYNNKSYKPDHNGTDWNIHIESWDGMGGNKIYNNEFWGGGMQIDIGGHFNIKGTSDYSFLVENNLFTDTTQKAYVSGLFGCGITIEGDTRDVIVRRNYFSNIGKGIGINATEYADPVRIYDVIRVNIDYNIFENIGYTNENSWNIELVSESANAVIEDIYIDNNVMISNPSIQSEAGLFIMPKGTMSNIRLRNNIIQGMRFAPIYLYYYTGQVSNLYNQNNILYNNGNSNLILYATTPPVINYVVSDTIMTDPLFIGGSPYSYALQSNSPAIDAGLDVGLVSDFIGTLVPYGSAPDIGAYEWFEVEYDFSNITLVNTPACYNAVDNTIISRWVATECPINFTLLRRDWYTISSADIGGFLAINIYGSFTGNDGDVISVYDLTTNSMYTGTITDSSGDPVLITDIPYVAGMDIKYLNDHTLYAGYYFEGRLTINGVVESLTVIASPDSFGYADLDVSGILRIKTSIGKVTNYLSLIQKDTNKSGQFTLEYRGCWYGSNEAWISEGSTTSPASEVIWYYAECVRSEEQGCNLAEYVPTDLNDAPFLNQFDTPVYWYGLPFDLSFILPERPELSPTSDIIVTMKVYNSANVQMGADIVQTIDVDSLEGYVNSLNINSTLIDAGAAYFTVEITAM